MIIWLSSYPKSGNTWARAFLSAYLNGGNVDINRLEIGQVASSRALLNNALGVETEKLPRPQVEALRPEAYRKISERANRKGRPAIIKVHDAWKMTPWREPLFPPAITQLAVYLVRNPLDVAVSFAHHLGVTADQSAKNLCDERYSLCVNMAVSKDQVPQLLRSWKSHVQSWLETSPCPVHLMKYEEMVAQPSRAFRGMIEAMKLKFEEERFQAALKASSLASLQAQEIRHGFREKSKNADAPFFRTGRPGAHVKELSPEAGKALRDYSAEVMGRLGYP